MLSEELKNSMQSDMHKLVSCTLTDVRVRTFFVEFLFSGSWGIIVRAKKEFKFELKSGGELYFDPARATHDLNLENSKFIFLQGMQCHTATLKDTVFEVRFVGGAKLWIEFDDSHFEPLELVGLSGERHEKLEFHYVL